MRTLVLGALILVAGVAGCASDDSHVRLRTAIDAHQEELSRCYAFALNRNEGAGGEMDLAVSMNDAGQVDGVQVLDNQTRDDGLQMCVAETLETVQLRPSPDGRLTVSYTMQFTPAN